MSTFIFRKVLKFSCEVKQDINFTQEVFPEPGNSGKVHLCCTLILAILELFLFLSNPVIFFNLSLTWCHLQT